MSLFSAVFDSKLNMVMRRNLRSKEHTPKKRTRLSRKMGGNRVFSLAYCVISSSKNWKNYFYFKNVLIGEPETFPFKPYWVISKWEEWRKQRNCEEFNKGLEAKSIFGKERDKNLCPDSCFIDNCESEGCKKSAVSGALF